MIRDFLHGSVVKNPPTMQETERHGFNPWVGEFPGVGNSSPFQYLGNPTDSAAWWLQSIGP